VKLKHIAIAALVPGVAAGVTVSAAALASSTTPAVHRPAPKVVTKAAQWVTVQRGQTLGSIAAAHHMTWQALVGTPPNNEHLRYPYRLSPGEHLRIPADPALRAAQFRGWERREAAARAAERAAEVAREKAAAAARASAAAAAQQAAAQQASQQAAVPATAGTGQSLTAGMSSFEQCVAFRESTDTPTDPDGLFGILPSTWAELGYSGTAGQASVAQQEVAFNRLYAEYGTQPWAPSDGC
jgi:LysM repeat protein